MRWALFVLAAIVPQAAFAQVSYPPVDPAKVVQQATTAATTAAQAQVPAICTNPPAPDAMLATAGVGVPCTPRTDAARQTQVPPAQAVTAVDGSFSGNWTTTLPAVPTRGYAAIFGTGTPYHCQLATFTTTGFTGKCWALVTTTLPSLPNSLLGLVVSPVANPAAGLTVNVFARY